MYSIATYTLLSKLLTALILLGNSAGFFQISTKWQPPQQVPNYEPVSRAPLLVADNESIHLFNYESVGLQKNAIFHRTWNPNEGWTPPVDIILTGLGGGPQTLQAADIDAYGNIHLIYYIGTEISGDFYHSSVPADQAHLAVNWSQPEIIAAKAGPLPFASLTILKNGELYFFFMSKQDGTGLYLIHSSDRGVTWSQPLALSLINEKDRWPASIQSMEGSNDEIHVAWSVVSDAGVGEEIRYGRLNAERNGLAIEKVLAKREGADYSANWPALVEDGEQLILVYQDSFPATRWMRISTDRGDTWSQPIRPFPHVGEYEYTALMKDSDGQVHMVLGNRTVDPEIHGMWYSRWSGNRWSVLEPITSGPVTDRYDPSAPQAVIFQGNVIFATWWHNVRRDNLSGAWYSYRLADAPRQIPVFQNTPTPSAAIEAEPTEVIDPSSTNTIATTLTPTVQNTFSRTQRDFRPALPVFLGIIPVFALVAAVYIMQNRNRRN